MIVASNADQGRHPGLYHNLLSHPHVRIQVGSRRQLRWPQWLRLVAQKPTWETYARHTTRKIPVMILHPLD